MALKQIHVSIGVNGVIMLSTLRSEDAAGDVKSRSKREEQLTRKSAAARLKQLAQEIENNGR